MSAISYPLAADPTNTHAAYTAAQTSFIENASGPAS